MNVVSYSNPAFDALALAAMAIVIMSLTILTMRSVSQRDRAMTIGKDNRDSDARRAAYERRWRSDVTRGV